MRKAIATGRITLEPDGTIDPKKADRQWSASTDAALQRSKPAASGGKKRKAAAPAADASAHRAAIEAVNQAVGGEGETVTFSKARTALEVIKVKRAQLDLAKRKGELVDRAKAERTVFEAGRRERDAWIHWPARIAALMAAELRVDTHALETALARHVREHLAALAEISVELR